MVIAGMSAPTIGGMVNFATSLSPAEQREADHAWQKQLTLTESLKGMFHRSVVLHRSEVAYELVVVSNEVNRQVRAFSFRSQRSYSLHYMRIKM